jgi:hypothetical protein
MTSRPATVATLSTQEHHRLDERAARVGVLSRTLPQSVAFNWLVVTTRRNSAA